MLSLFAFLVFYPTNCCQDQCQEDFPPMFSSRSFTVSGLMFRPWIHFVFIFVNGVGQRSNFILLHMNFQFTEETIFSPIAYSPLSYVSWPYKRDFVSEFLDSVTLVYVSVLMCIILLWLLQFCNIFWNKKCDAPSFALLFRTALSVRALSWSHTNFKIVLTFAVKKMSLEFR